MKKALYFLFVALLFFIILFSCSKKESTVAPVATRTPVYTATNTATITLSFTITTTNTNTPTFTITSTNTPTFTITTTNTNTPTFTITSTETITPTSTVTPTATLTSTSVTVKIQTQADAMISEPAPSTNYGSTIVSAIGSYGPSLRVRTLMKFDLSVIPTGATITDVRLIFVVDSFYPSDSYIQLQAYPLNADWVESTETWNMNAGGNFSTSEQIGAADVTSGGAWTLFLNINTVQAWLNGTRNNYGFIIKSNTEDNTSADWLNIYTKEVTEPSYRPYLQIKYVY